MAVDLEPCHVLIPIGVADLHEADDDVILPNVTVEQLRSLLAYEKSHRDCDHEISVRPTF
ncbi:hypothetical protein ACFSC6_07635 [Rufibacter sediminis]|uniref:Uncharacterized protein n=1 Tax=Rufibacter sediminis TaxID=2762756 RepID=A0ABR6VQT6_9BACT|nr:hypothetical protein [Rufibacter sediminis]MBC3539213.1 hypothetical protein [Rufibacter sediminis]